MVSNQGLSPGKRNQGWGGHLSLQYLQERRGEVVPWGISCQAALHRIPGSCHHRIPCVISKYFLSFFLFLPLPLFLCLSQSFLLLESFLSLSCFFLPFCFVICGVALYPLLLHQRFPPKEQNGALGGYEHQSNGENACDTGTGGRLSQCCCFLSLSCFSREKIPNCDGLVEVRNVGVLMSLTKLIWIATTNIG